MNENEHFWVTNLAFEEGGVPRRPGRGGPTPPGLYIYVCKTPTYRTEFGRRSLITIPGHCWPGVLFHTFLEFGIVTFPKSKED